MGRRATGTVEPLRESIRLKFTWLGKRRVETLDLAPTPANIKAAERLLAKVVGAIEAGATPALRALNLQPACLRNHPRNRLLCVSAFHAAAAL